MTTCTKHVETPLGICLLCGIPKPQWGRPPSTPKPKGKGLAQQSAKTIAGRDERAAIRDQVERRDRQCLACKAGVKGLGRARRPGTPHHLQKASAGGAYSLTNLVWLCAGHNSGVEDHPDLARKLGLVITSRGDDPVDATEARRRRTAHGLVP